MLARSSDSSDKEHGKAMYTQASLATIKHGDKQKSDEPFKKTCIEILFLMRDFLERRKSSKDYPCRCIAKVEHDEFEILDDLSHKIKEDFFSWKAIKKQISEKEPLLKILLDALYPYQGDCFLKKTFAYNIIFYHGKIYDFKGKERIFLATSLYESLWEYLTCDANQKKQLQRKESFLETLVSASRDITFNSSDIIQALQIDKPLTDCPKCSVVMVEDDVYSQKSMLQKPKASHSSLPKSSLLMSQMSQKKRVILVSDEESDEDVHDDSSQEERAQVVSSYCS